MATSIFGILNSFIPFADPTRPLWRDVFLSAIFCTVLYVAPQIDLAALRSRFLVAQERVEEPRTANGLPDNQEAERREVEHVEDPRVGVEHEDIAPYIDGGEEQQMRQPPQTDDAQGGPANPHQPRPRDPNREVGAKKAKSIARRNQQRAYNEWLREQGDAQRAEWARDEEQREQELTIERQRRAAIDAKLREKERSERDSRRAKEEAGRQAELEAMKIAVRMTEDKLLERRFSSIHDIAKAVKRSDEWVQQLVKREGLAGIKTIDGKRVATIVTRSGWIIRIDSTTMDSVYKQMATSCSYSDGRVTWDDIGRIVQRQVVGAG